LPTTPGSRRGATISGTPVGCPKEYEATNFLRIAPGISTGRILRHSLRKGRLIRVALRPKTQRRGFLGVHAKCNWFIRRRKRRLQIRKLYSVGTFQFILHAAPPIGRKTRHRPCTSVSGRRSDLVCLLLGLRRFGWRETSLDVLATFSRFSWRRITRRSLVKRDKVARFLITLHATPPTRQERTIVLGQIPCWPSLIQVTTSWASQAWMVRIQLGPWEGQ
jgi:hypothetical protein